MNVRMDLALRPRLATAMHRPALTQPGRRQKNSGAATRVMVLSSLIST